MKKYDIIPEDLTAYFDAYSKFLNAIDEIENKFKAYETEGIGEIQRQNLFQSFLDELALISNLKDTQIVQETLSHLQKRLDDHIFQLNVQAYVLKDMFSTFTDQRQATYAMKPKKTGMPSSLQMLEL